MNMKSTTRQYLNWLCLVIAAACWTGLSTANAQQAQPLRWKFTQGDTFDVTFVQTSNISSQVDQRVKVVNSILTISMAWNVNAVDENGNGMIEQKITGIKLLMTSVPTGVGKAIDIDTSRSEKPNKGPSADLLKQVEPLIGAAYTVVMSPRGEVIDVKIPESTLESLRKAPGSMRLRSLMSKTGLKDLFGQSLVVLPEEAPVEGQPWSFRADIDTGVGNFTRHNEYTWTGNRTEDGRTLAEIKLKTTLQPRDSANTTDVKFIRFDGNGVLVMNVTDGYFESSNTTNEMQTEKPYREKVIATTVKTTVEMQIKKK